MMKRSLRTLRARSASGSADGAHPATLVGGGQRVTPHVKATDPAKPEYRRGILEKHVPEILRLHAAGTPVDNIAKRFGSSRAAIYKITSGRSYRAGALDPGRGRRRGARRCEWCGTPFKLKFVKGRGAEKWTLQQQICPSCSDRCWNIRFDRDKGIGEIPEDLRRRYSLSG
jgi:hypothetical protein